MRENSEAMIKFTPMNDRPCWQRWAARWDSRRHRNPFFDDGSVEAMAHRNSWDFPIIWDFPIKTRGYQRDFPPFMWDFPPFMVGIFHGYVNQRVPVTDKTRQNTSKHHVFLQFSFMTMVKLTISRYVFFRGWQLNAI